ncbi:MAG: TraB/GumN family protein, partial [bacterium]
VKADPAIEPVYEKIIYKRNEGMASKIEGLLKTERTCFIVVGAGHLVGKKSIIELLRPKGYSIRQL